MYIDRNTDRNTYSPTAPACSPPAPSAPRAVSAIRARSVPAHSRAPPPSPQHRRRQNS